MKKILASILLLVTVAPSFAVTFWNGGVLFGTVCRNGYYYTAYPMSMAQPVGTSCPVRNAYGTVIGTGIVTDE